MPSNVRLSVNPQALKWVKANFGLSDAEMANKLNVSEEVYSQYESGTSKPTVRQLQAVAKRLKTPVAVFYLKRLPDGQPFPHDYRNRSSERPLSVKARLAFRRAVSTQEFLVDSGEWPPFDIGRFASSDPEQLARVLRAYVGYSPEQRISKDRLFELLRSKLEALGVLPLVLSLNTKEARGFSVHGKPPVVVVSASDAKSGQIFTMLHEFGHILKNKAGVCQPFEKNTVDLEGFCNRFASYFLITKEELTESLRDNSSLDDDNLQEIADHFKTSREVVLIKMIESNLATWGDYKTKREQWEAEYNSRPKFFPQPHPVAKTIRENGLALTSKVLEQVSRDRISYSEAAGYLNVNVGYLEGVGEKIGNQQ